MQKKVDYFFPDSYIILMQFCFCFPFFVTVAVSLTTYPSLSLSLCHFSSFSLLPRKFCSDEEKQRRPPNMMLKRQESALSSSSRRESAAPPPTQPENHHAKAIGCMSGFFRLISKYQHRRQFITFGRKPEKNADSSPTKPKTSQGPQTSPSTEADNVRSEAEEIASGIRRFSCEVPRSPTLPREIRLSDSANSSENSGAPLGPVARLMGLEVSQRKAAESVSERRSQLIGALDKCNEDLIALKKIIDAVRSAEPLRLAPPAKSICKEVEGSGGSRNTKAVRTSMEKKCVDVSNEQPSPVSVLDEFTRSPPSCDSRSGFTTGRMPRQQQVQKPEPRKKPGEDETTINLSLFQTIRSIISISDEKDSFSSSSSSSSSSCSSSSYSSELISKAMAESVNEVCRDIACGEKREIGRIGLVLQDYICRDLVEETVTELLGLFRAQYNNTNNNKLPFETCKRRLCFS